MRLHFSVLAIWLLLPATAFPAARKTTPEPQPKTGAGHEYDNVVITESADPAAAQPASASTVIRLRESEVLRPYAKEIFGINHDWLATPRLLFNRQGENDEKQVATLLAGVPFPINRVAGTESQHLRWKEAIGPLEERKDQKLASWTKPELPRFGPVEYIRLIRHLDSGAKVVWVPNLMKDSPEDIADLAEFLTGDGASNPNGGINWAQRRIDLGIEKPVEVAIWEIGNEMDWGIDWPVQQFIDVSRSTIQAIRSVDPKAKIALHATTAPWTAGKKRPWREWHLKVLRALGSEMDYLVFHPYYHGLPISEIEKYMDTMRDDIQQITGEDRIKLFISEHARWPAQPKEGRWEENWYKTHSLEGTLATAAFLVQCLNRPDVAAATYHSFSSGPWGLAYRDADKDRIYKTGIAEMFRMIGGIEGGEVIKIESPEASGSSTLSMAAVRSGDKMKLLIVNRGKESKLTFETERSYLLQGEQRLTGESLESHNAIDRDDLKIEKVSLPEDNGPFKTFTVAENSIVLLDLVAAPAAGESSARGE